MAISLPTAEDFSPLDSFTSILRKLATKDIEFQCIITFIGHTSVMITIAFVAVGTQCVRVVPASPANRNWSPFAPEYLRY